MGCALCSIFFIVYGYTQELSLLFGITSVGDQVKVAYVIRFIIGVGLVLSFPQTTTMVADYVKPGDRGKGFALHGAMVAFASLIVFGVLAQIAPKTGLISLFYTAGILGLLGLLITQFGTVDRVPKEKARAVGFKVLYHTVMQSRALKVGYGVTLINRSDIAVIATFLVLWMVYKAETVGLTPIEATARASIVLVVTSVVTLIAYPIIGMLVDRWGRIPVTITGLAAVGIGFCLIAATTNPFLPVIYGYAALLGVGFIAAGLGSGAMTADAAPRKLLGSILGGLNTMQPIGMLFFLQLGGWLFDEVGPWAPFLLKGVANLICCVVTFAVCRKAEFSLDAGDT
jgi:MFS family permease